MKALDLIKGNEKLLLEEAVESKKIKALSHEINELIVAMNTEINKFAQFKQSQIDGDFHYHAIVAKSLAEFFKGNKHLRVEDAVAKFESLEKQSMSSYYQTKTKLLSALNSLIKETTKEAAVSYFDLFEGELRKCEEGHEIIILGDRNNILLRYIVEELDNALIVSGHFAELEAQGVDYNLDTLNRNIELCTRKNNEVYGTKAGKLAKIQIMIDKLNSVGNNVVAFYTYKDALLDIGCNPKGVKAYGNELSKEYIPLKKGLQKEFKIELEDICDITVNEDSFPTADTNSIEQHGPEYQLDNSLNYTTTEEPVSFTSPFESAEQTNSPFDSTNAENTTYESTSENTQFDSSDSNPFESNSTNNWSSPFATNNEVNTTNSFAEENNVETTSSNPFDTFANQVSSVNTNNDMHTSEVNQNENDTTINNPFAIPTPANEDDNKNPFASPLSGSGINDETPTSNNNPFDSNPFDN